MVVFDIVNVRKLFCNVTNAFCVDSRILHKYVLGHLL